MKTALPIVATEETALIVEGSVSAALVTLLQTAVLRMIPYAIPAVFLLILDLLYGVKAAKSRGENVRASTAIRRTATKLFSYLCWIILATTLAISFGRTWLEWGVLAFVYINEFASIIGNMLELKGLELSFVDLWRLAFRKVAEKVGMSLDKEDVNEIIKPKEDEKE